MRVGLIQMSVEPDRRSANLSRALALVGEACESDPPSDLMVLPECCDLGPASPRALELAETVGGTIEESLAAKAREMGVYLVAGLTQAEGKILRSAAVLFDPDGDVLTRHRKICMEPEERPLYTPGDRLRIRRTLWGSVGVLIGSDLHAECMSQALSVMGAKVILAPCAWRCRSGREAHTLAEQKARIREFAERASLYVVAANSVGQSPPRDGQSEALLGGSLVVGPDGETLAEAPAGEEAIISCVLPLAVQERAAIRTEREVT